MDTEAEETLIQSFLTLVRNFTLSKLFSAVLTLAVCLLVIRGVMKLVRRVLDRSRLDPRVRTLTATGIQALLYVLTGVMVAQGLGVNMTSFVALLSVLSLGITLAVEDVLANFAGGLVILSSRPFSLGDFVESSGTTGTVESIDLFHTKLLNPDGQYILIPNKDLSASRIINYSSLGRRRVTVKICASYDAPTRDVEAACRDALARTENILADPEPAVWLTDYGESSIEYTIFCWTRQPTYWAALCGLKANLRSAFQEHGVEMTYNHLKVHLVERRNEPKTGASAPAASPERK